MKFLCKECGCEATAKNLEEIMEVNKLCPKHNTLNAIGSLRRVAPVKYNKRRKR